MKKALLQWDTEGHVHFLGKILAQVGDSNRKDVRNAVEAAIKAQVTIQ